MVENKFGVLARVAGLFSGRGFNIASLAVGETGDASVSQMTIVVDDLGNPQIMEQVEKQLNKLVDVIKIKDMTSEDCVGRELVLVRVKTTAATRAEILEIGGVFKARIPDISRDSVVFELTGSEGKVGAFLNLMSAYGVRELVRTGQIAIAR